MEKYLQLLKDFQRWNPEIVNQMRGCSHHFDSENLNPYHVEGDVWTHTMLMYKDFMCLVNNHVINSSGLYLKLAPKEVDRLLYLLGITILCHDIGKIYTRQAPNHQVGKITFYGHSFASVQPTIDFVLRLNKEMGANICESELYGIMAAISNHMDLLNIEDKKHIALMANNDYRNLFTLLLLNFFDERNALDNNLDFLNKPMPNIEEYTDFQYNFTKEDPDIVLYMGVPGSGKDFIAAQENLPIASFDDARVKIYKKDFPNDNSSEAEVYAKAWEHTKKKDLLEPIREFFEQHKKIAVCNTNLTRRLRSSLISAFYDKVFKIVYVVSDSSTIYQRNQKRTSKNIDRLVVCQFLYNQQVFSLFELRNYPKIKISGVELIINT